MIGSAQFDLSEFQRALRRKLLPLKLGVAAFVAILTVGSIAVALAHNGSGDELALPYATLYLVAILALIFLAWLLLYGFSPGARVMLINDQFVELRLDGSRSWRMAWSDPNLYFSLREYVVGQGANTPSDPFNCSLNLKGLGRSSLISPAAFDALVAASRQLGLRVVERPDGVGTQFPSRVYTITRST